MADAAFNVIRAAGRFRRGSAARNSAVLFARGRRPVAWSRMRGALSGPAVALQQRMQGIGVLAPDRGLEMALVRAVEAVLVDEGHHRPDARGDLVQCLDHVGLVVPPALATSSVSAPGRPAARGQLGRGVETALRYGGEHDVPVEHGLQPLLCLAKTPPGRSRGRRSPAGPASPRRQAGPAEASRTVSRRARQIVRGATSATMR